MKILNTLRDLKNRRTELKRDMSLNHHTAPHHHTAPQSLSEPHVFLDLPNLIRGEGVSVSEALAVLEEHIPLIERCSLKIWGALPTRRYASSLETIPESVHEVLRARGYTVEVASARLSETMQLEQASKLDDYLLAREVKRCAVEGARELLIVSGDRDFERLATELAVYGVKLSYVQRQRSKAYHNQKLRRYESLASFRAPLDPALEALLMSESVTSSQGKNANRLILRSEGRPDREVELSTQFKIGRMSERAGPVDLCLSRYDQKRDYSRQLAEISLLGSSWVLWRIPQDPSKLKRQPIRYLSEGQEPTLIGSGESVILSSGDRLRFDHCGLEMEFVLSS